MIYARFLIPPIPDSRQFYHICSIEHTFQGLVMDFARSSGEYLKRTVFVFQSETRNRFDILIEDYPLTPEQRRIIIAKYEKYVNNEAACLDWRVIPNVLWEPHDEDIATT